MLVCDAPEFVAWRPDFSSSGQTDPHWTRLVCKGEQLSNALDFVDWLDDELGTQVVLCEACGYTGCEFGGYVYVSRLREAFPRTVRRDLFEAWCGAAPIAVELARGRAVAAGPSSLGEGSRVSS
jgi:hypothetical protein